MDHLVQLSSLFSICAWLKRVGSLKGRGFVHNPADEAVEAVVASIGTNDQ